jgi:hypothetical protein
MLSETSSARGDQNNILKDPLTTRNPVHLVLNKEIYERHQRREETSGEPLPPFDRRMVRRA